jgi:hypothetical protein
MLSAFSAWYSLETPGEENARRMNEAADWQLPTLSRHGQRVLLLMIDGLPADVFDLALTSGELPHISRLLQERPTSKNVAVATFPSATSPSVQELLSGRYAELDGLSAPGAVHAFDRTERRIIRYVTEPDSWQWPVPTLFDALAGEPAVTVFEGRWDGPTAILTQYNMASQAILAAVGASALSNGDAGPVGAYIEALQGEAPPVVSLVVLNEYDVAGHFFGPDSPEALSALKDCDQRVGEILSAMATIPGKIEHSLLDETVIILFGDHGMVRSGQFINLIHFFAERDLKAVDVSTIPHVMFRERLGKLWTQWPDVILVAGGSNVTQVYLRDASGGWDGNHSASDNEIRRHSPPPSAAAIAEDMLELPGIEHILRRDSGGAIRIADRHGSALIYSRESRGKWQFAYLVDPTADSDPLGYLAEPQAAPLVCRSTQPVAACFHGAETWTDRTFASRFPGAVPLVPKVFMPLRFAGDLIVTSSRGYGFLRNQQGDHGSLAREALLTPLVLNGPGVHSCIETHVPRLVDIYPTASVLLGADPGDPALVGLDGRVLDCVAEPSRRSGVE